MKRILYILTAVILFSCANRIALPSEVILFPKPGANKIWLINTVSGDFHFCSLITFDTYAGREYLTSYMGLWSGKDSTYYSGLRRTDQATVAQITQFPVLLNLKADSNANKWNLQISRNKIVWHGELARERSKMKLKFKKQMPFNFLQILENPNVSTTGVIKSALNPHGKMKAKDPGIFCMSIFKTEKGLTALAQNGSLVWMDLILNDGTQFNGLIKVNPTTCVLLGYNLKDSSHYEGANRRLTIEAKTHWKSNASGKSYPLTFTIQFPDHNKTIHIEPFIEDQEIKAKKGSFWMGAMVAVDPEKKTRIGSGNMYIFNQ